MANEYEPYENLAIAIIKAAAQDYRRALKNRRRNPESSLWQHEVNRLEKFFFSGWYEVLTDVDGKYLVERLKAEVENE